MAKKVRQPGDNYRVTFSACLRAVYAGYELPTEESDMIKINGKLQYQLANGEWMDAKDIDAELNGCVKNNKSISTKNEAIEAMNSGAELRNSSFSDWYANCRIYNATKENAQVAAGQQAIYDYNQRTEDCFSGTDLY